MSCKTFFQYILGHRPVGRPFAASHGDQATAAHQHRVLAADAPWYLSPSSSCGLTRGRRPTQMLLTSLARPGARTQIAGRLAQDELHLGGLERRAARASRSWRGVSVVPKITFPQPWHGKQHPAIRAVFGTIKRVCLRAESSRSTTMMNALTGCHHGLDGSATAVCCGPRCPFCAGNSSTHTPAALITQRAFSA